MKMKNLSADRQDSKLKLLSDPLIINIILFIVELMSIFVIDAEGFSLFYL
jgi:hypothetical protein